MRGLWALMLWGCRPPEGTATVGLRRGEVLLAHTNDLHAHYLPEPAPWLEGSPRMGGFLAIDAQLRALRASAGEALYLDAGDVLTGTPLMEVSSRGVAGGAMLDFLEAVGCDAWAVGNHEFDQGLAHARRFVAASPVPVLVANAQTPSGEGLLPGSVPHVILEHNGLKVGVFGLLTDSMERLTSRETSAQIVTRDLEAAAREQVALLEPQVDLVVALTHAGLFADRLLARAVPGIDLIVGGHTHSAVDPPEKVGETWIVQAGSYGRQLGVVRLTVAAGEITALHGELVELTPVAAGTGAASPEVEALVRDLRGQLAAYDEQVGALPAPLLRAEVGQSPLGLWAAEVVRVAAGADVGAVNAGGLRADLAAGTVSRGDLYQVFPFRNEVQSIEISGDALLAILLQGVTRELEGRVPLQVSGATLAWRVHLGAPEVVWATVGGEPLVLGRTYRLATSSFLADQAEDRFGVAVAMGAVQGHGVTLLEAAVAAVRRGAVVPPESSSLRQ